MKKNRWYLRLLALLVLCGALNVTISAAAEAGSSDDPLVTLSYLNETFMDSIMERVDQKIAARNAQLGVSRQRPARVRLYRGDPHQRTGPHRGHRLRGDAAGGDGRLRLPLQPGPHRRDCGHDAEQRRRPGAEPPVHDDH